MSRTRVRIPARANILIIENMKYLNQFHSLDRASVNQIF